MLLLPFTAILLSICFANAKHESSKLDRVSRNLKTMRKHEQAIKSLKATNPFLYPCTSNSQCSGTPGANTCHMSPPNDPSTWFCDCFWVTFDVPCRQNKDCCTNICNSGVCAASGGRQGTLCSPQHQDCASGYICRPWGDFGYCDGGATTTATVKITTTSRPGSTPRPTDGWIAAANYVKQRINESANACTDFYEFACGTWIANNPIPSDHNAWYLNQWVQDQNIQKLATKLNSIDLSDPHLPSWLRKTKMAYDSCVTYDPKVSNPYNKYIILLLQNSSLTAPSNINGWGGWPIITPGWDGKLGRYSPASYAGLIQGNRATSTILNGIVSVDWQNVSRNILYVDQGELGLGAPEYYLNQTLYASQIGAYKNLIVNTAKLLAQDMGLDVNSMLPQMQADAASIIGVETRLASLMTPSANRRNMSALYNPMTVKEVKDRWPMQNIFNWDLYFFHLLPAQFLHRSNDTSQYFNGFYTLANDSTVIINDPNYVTNLMGILASTDNRTMVNYFLWRIVQPLLPLADNRIKQVLLNFKRQTEYVKDVPNQQKHCVRFLTETLPSAVGRLFVDGQFTSADRTAAGALIDGAFAAMGSMLRSVNWLDTQSTGNALTKLNGFVRNIGYSDWILNDTRMNAYYSSLNLIYADPSERGNWYFDSLTVTTFAQVNSYSVLYDAVDRTNFLLSPSLTSAWYQLWYNSMTIPAGILQVPLFRADFPAAVNYGSIGFTVAHEIAHGYDDRGIQFYANGALQAWMDEQSMVSFRQMDTCLVNQYSQICYPQLNGRCVSGVKTQGEDIADGAGIRDAFKAYLMYIAQNGPEQLLPGLEKYSMEQIFFINAAAQACGSANTNFLQSALLTQDVPGKERINAAMKNFEGFGKAFGCRQGVDPMYPNPANVCYVWDNPP